MDPSFVFVQALNGLATASSLFIMASGLTIVFGVTRIVNFAHGSLVMLGAYMAVTLVPLFLGYGGGPLLFFAAIFAAALAVGLMGVVMEVALLRRIYHAPELFQLLATFGVALAVQDLVTWIWGPQDILGPRAPGLAHAVEIFGRRFPAYELMMIAAGPLVLGALWFLFRRTRFGMLVRAATENREMVEALGVNQKLLFTGTLFLGAFLAGLGGALMTPRAPATPAMDMAVIVEAFVVTVIGGMGSVPGAFLAALVIGQFKAFGIVLFPQSTLVLVFLVMAVVLIVRPQGLLGPAEAPSERVLGVERAVTPWGWRGQLAFLAGCGAMALLPLFVDAYSLRVGIEVMLFALFAMSLGFLMGNGGVVSFGHAAYFGLGAYGAALAVRHLGWAMEPALLAAPFVAATGAALVGAFVARLSGVYLAMLTLAFAQIAYAVAFQWVWLTGGDNGLIGIWPSEWASDRLPYYYLTLALTAAAIYGLVRVTFSPFGYALRAGRDGRRRAEASGIHVARHRWAGFTLAGAAAGLAGALYTFSRGNVDPGVLSIPQSVDALAMVLLGGVQTVIGPLFGAAALHLLKDHVMPLTDSWRLILGAIIVALVLLFPRGLVGTLAALAQKVRR